MNRHPVEALQKKDKWGKIKEKGLEGDNSPRRRKGKDVGSTSTVAEGTALRKVWWSVPEFTRKEKTAPELLDITS